nr:DNA gyrase subunit A [Lachnospiraceae bacterium]
RITEKTGNVVGAKAVSKDDQLMLINNEGIIIRLRVNDTALLKRNTSGVKLINLGESEFVASIAKVRREDIVEEQIATDEETEEEENGEKQ